MAAEIAPRRQPGHGADGTEPVDLAHLARQAGGDQELAREVLSLFLTRVVDDLDRLKKAAPGTARREVAHLIVGSARAVGASEIARRAAAIEAGGSEQASAMAALEAAVFEARRFVAERLAHHEFGRD